MTDPSPVQVYTDERGHSFTVEPTEAWAEYVEGLESGGCNGESVVLE